MNKLSKKITIVTVTLNNLSGLVRTFNSIQKQKSNEIEYIIIDGISNDGTIEFLKSKNDLIDNWVSEKDSGIYDAMNKGAKLSSGEYLLFLNSGDELCDNAIETFLYQIDAEYADIYYGQIYLDRGDSDKKYRKHEILFPKHSKLYDEMSIFHPSTLISKLFFNKMGMYDVKLRLASDYKFFLKSYFNNAIFSYIKMPLVLFEHGGFSSMNPYLSLKENIKIKFEILPLYLSIPKIIILLIKYYGSNLLSKIGLFILGKSFYNKLLGR
jgi:glycosyltransferase involved in cell wall biosynthesis